MCTLPLPESSPGGAEGVKEDFIPRDVSHDAQLDLGVVRDQERAEPLAGNEGSTDLTTLVSSDRDVLQVRVR